MRPSVIVDVHGILRDENSILMQLRQNTGFADGLLHLPAGHVEADEDAIDALRRELSEELDIQIERDAVSHALTLHHFSNSARVSFFFEIRQWAGTPRIAEPDKCARLEWITPADLGDGVVPYAAFALQQIQAGNAYASLGWPEV